MMSFHGYDPGDRNNWYQSPQLGLFPVSPAVHGGGISDTCYNTHLSHPHGSPNYPPPPSQFPLQPSYPPPPQFRFQPSYSPPPPPPSQTIINGYVFPHQFPCVPQTHSQFFPPPYLQPIHPIAPQPLITTPQSPSIPTSHLPHPTPNIWIHPSIPNFQSPAAPIFVPQTHNNEDTKNPSSPPPISDVSVQKEVFHSEAALSSLIDKLEMLCQPPSVISTEEVGLASLGRNPDEECRRDDDAVVPKGTANGVNLASTPELYPKFVSLNTVPSNLNLLSHDSTDIAIDAVSAQRNNNLPSFCWVSDTSTRVCNQFNFLNDDCSGMGFVFGANGIDEKLENGESVEKRAEVNSRDGREFSEPESVSAKQDEGEDKEQLSNGMSEFHALQLFDKMPERNIFSWKTLISSWVRNGQEEKTLGVYDAMIWLQSISKLQAALVKAEDDLSELPSETPYSEFDYVLHGLGFERGWGDTAEHVLEMMHLLLDILQAPDPTTLETFLGRVPVVFNVVILSPHGYFGQANVLGLPDTGGQVVYIPDQVRALENEMLQRIKRQGLNFTPRVLIVTRLIPDAKGTTCNQRLERVTGTEHNHILQVPFRSENGILRKWISKFDVWPYLETFAEDVVGEITAELQGHPDFIIGNYSDGNLVASLLAYKMGVTQCTIAHALENTKYPDSDIYWKKYDEKYHFSYQFTADLIAMNNADFIITRLDQVKNMTGLVESYGKNAKLTELINLVLVAGYNDGKKSKDREEIAEIEKMHALIKEYNLNGQFRWISSQTNRARHGELYRYIADTGGVLVQPALYAAFGLTVVEAMTCDLQTFVTINGGPAEIIEHGISGFHIDPYHSEQMAAIMADFFQCSQQDPSYWKKIADGGLKRIFDLYKLYVVVYSVFINNAGNLLPDDSFWIMVRNAKLFYEYMNVLANMLLKSVSKEQLMSSDVRIMDTIVAALCGKSITMDGVGISFLIWLLAIHSTKFKREAASILHIWAYHINDQMVDWDVVHALMYEEGFIIEFVEKPKDRKFEALIDGATNLGIDNLNTHETPYLTTVDIYVLYRKVMSHMLQVKFSDFGTAVVQGATYISLKVKVYMVVGCCKEIVHTWLSKFPAVQFCSLSDDAFGDIVGMESDLFSSYAESFCAALVVASISSFVIHHEFTTMLYPLLVSSMGINDVWLQYVDVAIVTTSQLESISENQGNGVVIEKMESSNLLFKELDVTDRNIITHLSKDFELPRKVEDTDCYWKWFASKLASGGASSLLFVYSLYYACTHLARDSKATKKGGEQKFNGLVDVYRKTLKSDGIAGLYHGSIISCVEAIMVIKAMPERRLVSSLSFSYMFLR